VAATGAVGAIVVMRVPSMVGWGSKATRATSGEGAVGAVRVHTRNKLLKTAATNDKGHEVSRGLGE
jgi:hypothetical protein